MTLLNKERVFYVQRLQREIKLHFTQIQNTDMKQSMIAAVILGGNVQNSIFCYLFTSQWSKKKCAKTPFPIPLELVPHD